MTFDPDKEVGKVDKYVERSQRKLEKKHMRRYDSLLKNGQWDAASQYAAQVGMDERHVKDPLVDGWDVLDDKNANVEAYKWAVKRDLKELAEWSATKEFQRRYKSKNFVEAIAWGEETGMPLGYLIRAAVKEETRRIKTGDLTGATEMQKYLVELQSRAKTQTPENNRGKTSPTKQETASE